MKNLIKVSAIHISYVPFKKGDTPETYVEKNMKKTFDLLHEAGRNKVDLVCTNEDFTHAGVYVRDLDNPDIFTSLAEPVPGPTSEKLGAIAKQYGMYIAANYYEKDGSKIYNTSVLIGRDGEIAGKYRKVHPADGERWRVEAGDTFPAIETDIGKIGFAICYDIVFPEVCRCAALNGADIIIHQTQGWGVCGKSEPTTNEGIMRARAAENSVYLVVAKNTHQGDVGKSCIIDNNGTILAQSRSNEEGLVTAEFQPDYDMLDEYNFDNFYAGVPSTKARQLLARIPEAYKLMTDKNAPVYERYGNYKIHGSVEEGKEILKKWKQIDRDEKSKFHW